MKHIYDEAMSREGIEVAGYQSDLYLMDTPQARELLQEYGYHWPSVRCSQFRNNLDGKIWFDVALMYLPFWIKREVKATIRQQAIERLRRHRHEH